MLLFLYIALALTIGAGAWLLMRTVDYLIKPGERYVYALIVVYGIIAVLVININRIA